LRLRTASLYRARAADCIHTLSLHDALPIYSILYFIASYWAYSVMSCSGITSCSPGSYFVPLPSAFVFQWVNVLPSTSAPDGISIKAYGDAASFVTSPFLTKVTL